MIKTTAMQLKVTCFHFVAGTTPGSGVGSPPTESEEDASILRARLDAECQQLARDLQAAVRDLVRPELTLGTSSKHGMNGGSSGSGRRRAMEENHDYSEIYTPSSDEKLGLSLAQPPPPPMHR